MRYRWNQSGDAIEELSGQGSPTGRTIPKGGPLFKVLTEPPSFPPMLVVDEATGAEIYEDAEPAADPIEIEPYAAPEPAGPVVPASVPAASLRIALRRADLFDMAEELVAGSDDPDLKDQWEYSSAYSAGSPVVLFVAEKMGLSDADVAAILGEAAGVVT